MGVEECKFQIEDFASTSDVSSSEEDNAVVKRKSSIVGCETNRGSLQETDLTKSLLGLCKLNFTVVTSFIFFEFFCCATYVLLNCLTYFKVNGVSKVRPVSKRYEASE